MQKTTKISQRVDSIQIISDIEVVPNPYCPVSAPSAGYNFTNKANLDLKTVVDVSNVNTSDITGPDFCFEDIVQPKA